MALVVFLRGVNVADAGDDSVWEHNQCDRAGVERPGDEGPLTNSDWQPYREPLRSTLWRTGTIALVLGAVLARWWGGLARWPIAVVLLLWRAFGGHWVELWFLNWLRP